MGLGLLIILGSAVAITLMWSASGTKVSVVVAARDLKPGEPVKRSDLRSIAISADESLAVERTADSSELIDRVPLAPLRAGTLLQLGLFASGSDLAAGETVVAASLQPGEVPTDHLRAGDTVAAVQVIGGNAGDQGGSTFLGIGTVYAVSSVKGDTGVIVSIRVPAAQGQAIAGAAGQKRLRLMLVPPGASADLFTSPPTSEASTSPPTTGPSTTERKPAR